MLGARKKSQRETRKLRCAKPSAPKSSRRRMKPILDRTKSKADGRSNLALNAANVLQRFPPRKCSLYSHAKCMFIVFRMLFDSSICPRNPATSGGTSSVLCEDFRQRIVNSFRGAATSASVFIFSSAICQFAQSICRASAVKVTSKELLGPSRVPLCLPAR